MQSLWSTLEWSFLGAKRLAETGVVLAAAGWSLLAGDRPPAPRLLRQTFERLGATYIKLGQFIASTPSIFGKEYSDEFQTCLDQTDPLPFETVERVLHEEFGSDLSRIFARIDPEPIASASIAQVHAGRLVSGSEIVLKVQKPDAAVILSADLNFLYVAAKLIELFAPGRLQSPLTEMLAEIHTVALAECDFLEEARNMTAFGAFLRDQELRHAAVPQVYDHATTARVITMQRFYGVPLTDPEVVRRICPEPEKAFLMALSVWFRSVVSSDFFHADVHAGNLLLLEDGRIGFIDFGIVGRLAPTTRSGVRDFLQAGIGRDYATMALALATIGAVETTIPLRNLSADLARLFGNMDRIFLEARVDGTNLDQIVFDLVGIGENYGLRFPRELLLLFKQFLYFDRYAQVLGGPVALEGGSLWEAGLRDTVL